MELIDGNAIAQEIIAEVAEEVSTSAKSKPPTIAFIRVGEDPASVSYVRKKEKTAASLGIESQLHLFPDTISKEDLFAEIDNLNANPAIDGILVQSPLPSHISDQEAFNRVHPSKDVDGFHPSNLGKLCQGDESGFVACTPSGVVELLSRSGVSIPGKQVVIVGRSLIVGKPLSLLFLRRHPMGDATVSICHSKTPDLAALTREADILVAAVGRPEIIRGPMVKPGAVVIDVGVNRVPDPSRKSGYSLKGDVHFPEVSALASRITPVPGGVGPMTVAMLMRNTVKAWHLANGSA
ncbi:MAG: bifunctional methylenetetrahydrofolate dehydrogenase/methenyltetrahydrofolate cyclohydrolase FolD [Verrucomicrobiota bacterium]